MDNKHDEVLTAVEKIIHKKTPGVVLIIMPAATEHGSHTDDGMTFQHFRSKVSLGETIGSMEVIKNYLINSSAVAYDPENGVGDHE